MDLAPVIREALENQVFEHEPGQAALVLRKAVADAGPEAVGAALLDAAAVALRRMVIETDEAFEQDELLDRLAFDGAVPTDSIDVLRRMLALAAATAGGVRPPIDPVVAELGPERALFGAWLTALTAIRVVAISLERTEADVVDEMVRALDHF
jgi:hypothetical protein